MMHPRSRVSASSPWAGRADVRVVHHREAWNAYVRRHRRGTLYHRYEWMELVDRCFGQDGIPLAAVAENRLVGVLPLVRVQQWGRRSLISVPFGTDGGALTDSVPVADALSEYARGLAEAERADHFEIRGVHGHGPAGVGPAREVALLLGSTAAQWRAIGSARRNRVRRSMLAGSRCTTGAVSCLRPFYDLYATVRRDAGMPGHDIAFFDQLLELFGTAVRIFVVGRDRAEAAAVALHHRHELEVRWMAWREDAHRSGAVDRLYWELFVHGIKSAATRIAWEGEAAAALSKWRSHWGAPGPCPPPERVRWPRLAARLWRCIPIAVAAPLGGWITRQFP